MRLTTAAGAAALAAILLASACGTSEDKPAASGESGRGISVSTVESTCTLLVGPSETWVDDALAAGESGNKGETTKVQDSLFKIVSAGPAELQDLAGALVDYLDDPAAYVTGGSVDRSITAAADKIKAICEA